MADLTKQQMSELARLGAKARLAELVAEEDAILRAYPDLGGAPSARRGDGAVPTPAAKPRRPYHMSPAKRKAAAERMRAYWAAKREARQGDEAAPTATPAKRQRARKTARKRSAK